MKAECSEATKDYDKALPYTVRKPTQVVHGHALRFCYRKFKNTIFTFAESENYSLLLLIYPNVLRTAHSVPSTRNHNDESIEIALIMTRGRHKRRSLYIFFALLYFRETLVLCTPSLSFIANCTPRLDLNPSVKILKDEKKRHIWLFRHSLLW